MNVLKEGDGIQDGLYWINNSKKKIISQKTSNMNYACQMMCFGARPGESKQRVQQYFTHNSS